MSGAQDVRRNGRRTRPLSAEEKYRIWQQLLTGESSQRQAAERWQVDPTTIMRILASAPGRGRDRGSPAGRPPAAGGATRGPGNIQSAKLDRARISRRLAHRIRRRSTGAGDPAWDLGAAAGDYLSRWLLSVRPSAGDGLAAWMHRATVPRGRCAEAARAVLAAYVLARPLPDRDRVAACEGVFLVHRAYAWVERDGALSAKPTLLARGGARLAVGRWAVLGSLLEGRS
jgi:transposase-like protein